MVYDRRVTLTTVAGRGNPIVQSSPSLHGTGPRVRASMAAPGGASYGWAGSLYPVFHPRQVAAAPIPTATAAPARRLS